ncbi:4Fe-4S binding protein [Megasphaera sp. DISK 18]|uniref:4Fe-4S binding protein n=1 Tax=Megasphaera sp. DISK 18 TaxID=1776081 RepID=UPI0008071769|nr:4Fe-4S binding protein [Megasphaera sp. DISK 18]OBZ33396.1 ferredoxin [Megasphaera sp. DISK 18]
MKIQQVYSVYFSPTGHTKAVVDCLAGEIAKALQVPLETVSFDLPAERQGEYHFSAQDLVVVGGPTYAGKLPNKIMPTYREKLFGKGTPAVAMVTYGNRSFDNSLAELCAILEENDFNLVGAGAFVAQHAFSKILASGRPDEDDLADVRSLAGRVIESLQGEDCPTNSLAVDGDAKAPYYIPKGEDGQPAKFLKAVPKTDMEKCTSCGLCARQCPMGSIDKERPDRVTGICIKCQRCVHTCPYGAKYFDDPAFLSHVRMLEQHYKDRASNKIFTR